MMTAADIAGRLGLEKYLRSWRGTCPVCSYQRVFSVKASKSQTPLFYCANGCDQERLTETLAGCFGDSWTPPPKPTEDDAAKRARGATDALKLWAGSETTITATPVEAYLRSRGLAAIIGSSALRYRGDCVHPEERCRFPAMVAGVQDTAGAVVAIHRTYLTRQGAKAAVEPPKASKGPVWGGAIRIHPVAAEIVVGEGIETSASAGLLLSLPAWAAISAGNLARGLQLPPEVRSVIIAADNDPVGSTAAQDAAIRWRAEGRRVRIARPDRAGADFNDVLMTIGEAHAHAA